MHISNGSIPIRDEFISIWFITSVVSNTTVRVGARYISSPKNNVGIKSEDTCQVICSKV